MSATPRSARPSLASDSPYAREGIRRPVPVPPVLVATHDACDETNRHASSMKTDAVTLPLRKVAARLGLTPQYVAYLTRRGQLTATQTPLGRLYDADEVERIAAERSAGVVRR